MKQTLALFGAMVALNYGNVACGWSPAFNHIDANQVNPNLSNANTEGVPGCDFYCGDVPAVPTCSVKYTSEPLPIVSI